MTNTRPINHGQSGSIEQFECVIDEYQDKIYRYCYHMLGQHYDAEDAVQEVFIKAYQNMAANYKENGSFSAWVYKIAHNHCLNVLRRKKLARFLPMLYETRETGAKQTLDTIENEPLQELLMKLSPIERSIVIFRIAEQKDYQEIAELLQRKPATVRKQFERALRKCKRFVGLQQGGYSYGSIKNI